MRAETNSYLHFEKHQSQFIELPIIHMGGRFNTEKSISGLRVLLLFYRTNTANYHVKQHKKITNTFHLHDE
jgi:hypothetical protein